MIDYNQAASHGPLEALPPLRETSGYRIVRGDPRASIRLDVGEMQSRVRAGVWRCTEGAFECVETGDELQTLVRGRLRIVREDGSHSDFVAGDSFFTRKGERLIWDIAETVEKVFFTYNVDGSDT